MFTVLEGFKMATYDLVKTITLHFNCVEASSEAGAIASIEDKSVFDADAQGEVNTFVLWSSDKDKTETQKFMEEHFQLIKIGF